MAVCTNLKTYGNLVEDFITEYEKVINDETLSEVETTDTQEALDKLYALRRAVKENDLSYIRGQSFVTLQEDSRKELMTDAFSRTLGSSFGFRIGASQKTRQGVLLSAKPTQGGVAITLSENGRTTSYTFPMSSDGRSQNSKNTGSYITIPGFRNFLDNYTMDLAAKESSELTFGSEGSKLKLDEEYRQDGYVHGSQSHMRLMLQNLHILGGSKASQEELDMHLDILEKMSPEFFNDLKLYIKGEAERTEGVASTRRIDMTVKSAPATIGNQQSEASVYMEEVVHSMTAAAIAANTVATRKLKRQLDNFIETARKQITYKDFLPKESIDKKAEEAYAKWLYNYIFSGKNASYEFIAKGITVPEVANAFKNVRVKEPKESNTIFEKIASFLETVIDILRGEFNLKQKNQNVHDALINLAFNFGELNTKAARTVAEEGGFLSKVFDVLNSVDDQTALAIGKAKDSVMKSASTKPLNKAPEGLYEKVKDLGNTIGLSIVNPTYTKAMGSIAGAYGLKANGTIREIVGGLFATDSTQKVAEFLGMQSGRIDRVRNDQTSLVSSNVLSEFNPDTEVTRELEEDLTAVLSDTALASLFGKESAANTKGFSKTVYDNKTLRSLLTDDERLGRLIKDAKRTLKALDNTHYHWHSNQATGLGIYMATHKGTPEQNLNSHNIARGLRSSHRKRPKKEVVAAINELAILTAVKNTNSRQKTSVAQLMKEDFKGVQHVADVIEGFSKNSEAAVFKGRQTNKILGYSKEIFDDSIVMEIALESDRAKMEAQGFTFKSTLQPRAGDIRNSNMALYVSDTATRPDRLRGSVRLNQITSKGTTITDAAYKDGEGFSGNVIRERAQRDINNIEAASVARAKLMEEGEYDFTDTVFGVLPVINEDGKVTDYRYMMDKETKQTLLKGDRRISAVMGSSFGSILDKEASTEHNNSVLKELKKDMLENWTSGTKANDGMTDYTLIGPKASDPEMRKLYYMLPREFKDFINNRQDKTLAVRTDLLYLHFGYSNLSMTDFPGLKKITPAIIIKMIKFAEMLFMETVKIVKSNILLKMPTILLSNIFSNLVYAVMKGYNPFKLPGLYMESYRDITEYNKNNKRLQELTNKERSITVGLSRDNLSTQRRAAAKLELTRVRGEMEALKIRISDSPIHELVQLGVDQNVEDISNETGDDSNRITSYIDSKLEGAPELVRDGLDILFITKRTKFYKVANEFLATSDLVARDVQNRLEQKIEEKQVDGQKVLPDWWLDQQSEGYNPKQRLTGEERKLFLAEAKKERHYDLVEDFINYTKPSSKMEEYLNKVGILMFTKYVKRIQRIIIKNSGRAPIKTVIGAFGIGYLGGLPSIHEQSFFVKDWYGDSIGPGNVFPVYSPIENLMNFITPSLLKASTYSL